MKADTALRQRERVVMPVAHQGDVRLVVHDPGEDVVCGNGHRETFALTEGGGGLIGSPRLGEQYRRERVNEREVAAIASGVQRRRRFGQLLADDAGIADAAIGEGELVMCEPDGARVVRQLGVLERARMMGDGARLITACERQAAVQPPQHGELAVRKFLAQSVGRAPERGGSLGEVVLQQVRFSQRCTNGQFVLAIERARTQQRREHLRRLCAAPALERPTGFGENRRNCLGSHGRSIQSIQLGGSSYNPEPMQLASHGVSHKGRRKSNEDAMVIDAPKGLFVVADGMGGHNAGEVASALAVKTLHDFISQANETNEATLSEALCLANDHVLSAAAGNSTYEGMGTTVVAAFVNDGSVVFGSVGDSRIYLLRGGSLQQLTNDDSWVSRVLPADAIGSEEASRHPMRHVLTKVIGLREDMEPSVGTAPFSIGDTLLLCSDGLHGVVNDEAIAATLRRTESVDRIASELVEQALRSGSTDNITAVVVRKL